MHKGRWVFYTDLFGRRRWEKIDNTGLAIAESQKCFPTLDEALADASFHGYRPGDDCIACDFEWRREAVDSFSVSDETAADLVLIK